MANKILQHDSTVTPQDEDEDKDYLDKSSMSTIKLSERLKTLTGLYPQGSSREKNYKRYVDIDLSAAKVSRRPDMTQAISWSRVLLVGLIFPLPFFALDAFFVLFISLMPTLIHNASVAMMGIPYVMFVVITMFGVKRYFDRKMNEIDLNAFPLFWSSVFFALPFVQVLRFWLVPTLLDGLAPPVNNSVMYSIAMVILSTATLSLFTYIYYRFNKSQEIRIRTMLAVASIPYLIGLPMAVFAIIQLFRP